MSLLCCKSHVFFFFFGTLTHVIFGVGDSRPIHLTGYESVLGQNVQNTCVDVRGLEMNVNIYSSMTNGKLHLLKKVLQPDKKLQTSRWNGPCFQIKLFSRKLETRKSDSSLEKGVLEKCQACTAKQIFTLNGLVYTYFQILSVSCLNKIQKRFKPLSCTLIQISDGRSQI